LQGRLPLRPKSAPRKAGRRPPLQPSPQIHGKKTPTAYGMVYFLSGEAVYSYSALDSEGQNCKKT